MVLLPTDDFWVVRHFLSEKSFFLRTAQGHKRLRCWMRSLAAAAASAAAAAAASAAAAQAPDLHGVDVAARIAFFGSKKHPAEGSSVCSKSKIHTKFLFYRVLRVTRFNRDPRCAQGSATQHGPNSKDSKTVAKPNRNYEIYISLGVPQTKLRRLFPSPGAPVLFLFCARRRPPP
jgi:hypothetical protein